MSKTLSCEINPFWKQQTLINNYTGKEYLVAIKEIPDNLYFLFSKGDIEKVTDTEEKENLRKRLSRLLGGVALIEVGAMTKTEQNFLS